MTGPVPAVGRIVHYLSRSSADGEFPPACRSAVITAVGCWVTDPDGIEYGEDSGTRVLRQTHDPEALCLAVLNPTGVLFNGGQGPVQHDEAGRTPGSWHWPERKE